MNMPLIEFVLLMIAIVQAIAIGLNYNRIRELEKSLEEEQKKSKKAEDILANYTEDVIAYIRQRRDVLSHRQERGKPTANGTLNVISVNNSYVSTKPFKYVTDPPKGDKS